MQAGVHVRIWCKCCIHKSGWRDEGETCCPFCFKEYTEAEAFRAKVGVVIQEEAVGH